MPSQTRVSARGIIVRSVQAACFMETYVLTPNTMDGIFRDPAAHISPMLREIGKLSYPVCWRREMQRTLWAYWANWEQQWAKRSINKWFSKSLWQTLLWDNLYSLYSWLHEQPAASEVCWFVLHPPILLPVSSALTTLLSSLIIGYCKLFFDFFDRVYSGFLQDWREQRCYQCLTAENLHTHASACW